MREKDSGARGWWIGGLEGCEGTTRQAMVPLRISVRSYKTFEKKTTADRRTVTTAQGSKKGGDRGLRLLKVAYYGRVDTWSDD